MTLGRLVEWIRGSLFFVPLMFSVGAVVLAEAALAADHRVVSMPERLTATVESARTVLSVVAGATVTFAAIAFSVSLLLISAASSQFSPRVVHGLFRDPFNKRVMGITVGTFIYCLVVIRSVRGPLEDAGMPSVPSISVLVALVLGVVALLALVAFINHAAHSMEISKLLHEVVEDSLAQVRSQAAESHEPVAETPEPEGKGFLVVFDQQGWVQEVEYDAVLACAGPGGTVKIETAPGRYAIPEVPICRLWPAPQDAHQVTQSIRRAVAVGESRTMRQDASYGVRQLADVALKALSPGINDPTTAQDALFHLSSVVREMLACPTPPARRENADGTLLILPDKDAPREIVDLAFDEVRIASVGQPTVQIYLLQIMHLLTVGLGSADAREGIDAIRRQAQLVLALSETSDLTPADHARVRAQYDKRFGA